MAAPIAIARQQEEDVRPIASSSGGQEQEDDARAALADLLDNAPTPAPITAAEVQSFEGPEKLLELWFADAEDSPETRGRGLLDVDRATWETMLAEVRCQVCHGKGVGDE